MVGEVGRDFPFMVNNLVTDKTYYFYLFICFTIYMFSYSTCKREQVKLTFKI